MDDEYARMITIVTQTEERTRIMEERARKMSDILAKKAWQAGRPGKARPSKPGRPPARQAGQGQATASKPGRQDYQEV